MEFASSFYKDELVAQRSKSVAIDEIVSCAERKVWHGEVVGILTGFFANENYFFDSA